MARQAPRPGKPHIYRDHTGYWRVLYTGLSSEAGLDNRKACDFAWRLNLLAGALR